MKCDFQFNYLFMFIFEIISPIRVKEILFWWFFMNFEIDIDLDLSDERDNKTRLRQTCPALWLMWDGLESSSRACFLGNPTSLPGLLIAALRPFQNSCIRHERSRRKRKEIQNVNVVDQHTHTHTHKHFFRKETGKKGFENRMQCKAVPERLFHYKRRRRRRGKRNEKRKGEFMKVGHFYPSLLNWNGG